MEIETKEVVEAEETEETSETTEETADSSSKVELTDEEKLTRLEGGVKRLQKKLGIVPPAKEEVKKVENKKSDDTDYIQETYLLANGIKEADEMELFKERLANSGKTPKEVIANKYFQEDLKELRETKAVKLATPPGSPRSTSSPRDTVEYWRAKIDSGAATLLDIQDVKLRRQIVNARLTKEKDVDHFTSNPFGTIDIGATKK